jgi:hypothetical protein
MSQESGYRYVVSAPPNSPDAAEVMRWALQELEKLSNVINNLAGGHVDIAYREPERPRDGMVRLADGTKWNPGSGRGYYGYDEASSSWLFLG